MTDVSEAGLVLVVDDDAPTKGRLTDVLDAAGHPSFLLDDPEETLRAVFALRPALAVLAVAAGNGRGWSVLERLRECCTIPVLTVGPGPSELDVVRALRAGADDHVARSVGAAELTARIDALLRRAGGAHEAVEVHDDGFVRIDYQRWAVHIAGVHVRLTPLEFRLLDTLVRHAGHVLSHDQLRELVWGYTDVSASDEVRVYIRYLRRKLGAVSAEGAIQTVRGFGYAYAPPPVVGLSA